MRFYLILLLFITFVGYLIFKPPEPDYPFVLKADPEAVALMRAMTAPANRFHRHHLQTRFANGVNSPPLLDSDGTPR